MTPPNLDDLTNTDDTKKSASVSIDDLLGPDTAEQQAPTWDEVSPEEVMAEAGLSVGSPLDATALRDVSSPVGKTLIGDSRIEATPEEQKQLATDALVTAGSVAMPALVVPKLLGKMAGPGVKIASDLIGNPEIRTAAEGLADTVGATGKSFLQTPGVKEAGKRILANAGTATVGAEAGRQVARGVGADDSSYSTGDTVKDLALNTAFGAVPELASMRGAMKNAALVSDEAGSAANVFRAGDSRAGWSQAIRQRFTNAWDNIKNSGILQGGTVYDAQTGKMIAGKGPQNTDFDSILKNLSDDGTILPQLGTAKADALGKVDTQVKMYRKSSGDQNFGTVALPDLQQEMRDIYAKANKAGSSPLRTEAAAGYKEALDTVEKIFGNYDGNVKLDIPDVEKHLSEVYNHLRDLGKYDTDVAAAQMQGVMSDPVARGAGAQVYTAAADALKNLRNKALSKVFQQDEIGTALKSMNVNPDSVQNASDTMSAALTIRDTMEHYLYSLNPDAARAEKVSNAAGAGMAKISKTGVGAATTGVFNMAKEPFGYGPDTLSFRSKRDTLDRARGIINYEGPGRVTNFMGQAGAGGGVTMGNVGRGLSNLPAPDQDTPSTLELYGHFAKEGFTPKQPLTQGFPRKISALVENQDDFLKAVAGKLGMEGASKVEEIINGKLPPTEKQRALGEFMSQFPEVNDIMQPSNFPSEIDGRLHSQEDLSNAASEIENNPSLSIREKALGWRDLWEKKKYSGGKIYSH